MKAKYSNWIKKHYPTPQSAINQCSQACEKLRNDFPELIITNGLIQVGIEKDQRSHWWARTINGEIIDPTAHQYEAFGSSIIFYTEITDDHDLRNFEEGRCSNCGEHYFIGKDNWNCSTTCSSSCFKSYVKYLNGN